MENATYIDPGLGSPLLPRLVNQDREFRFALLYAGYILGRSDEIDLSKYLCGHRWGILVSFLDQSATGIVFCLSGTVLRLLEKPTGSRLGSWRSRRRDMLTPMPDTTYLRKERCGRCHVWRRSVVHVV